LYLYIRIPLSADDLTEKQDFVKKLYIVIKIEALQQDHGSTQQSQDARQQADGQLLEPEDEDA
jgi:hypothetical protein